MQDDNPNDNRTSNIVVLKKQSFLFIVLLFMLKYVLLFVFRIMHPDLKFNFTIETDPLDQNSKNPPMVYPGSRPIVFYKD